MTGGNSPSDRAFGGSGSSSGRQGQQSVGELGREMKEGTRHAAEKTYEQVKEFTGEAMDKARQQWSESTGRLTHRVSEVAERQKEQVCKGMDDAIEAARAAAGVLEERNDPQVASWAHWAADGLEHTRNYLRRVEMDHIVDDVRHFTRRHPEWVLGGLFITGLAVARFLKADRIGSRHRPPRGADEGLWQDVVEYQRQDDWHRQSDRGFGRGWEGSTSDRSSGMSSGASAGVGPGPRGTSGAGFGGTGGARQGIGSTGGASAGTYDTDAGRATTGTGTTPGTTPGTTGGSTIGGPQRGDQKTDIGGNRPGGAL